MQTDIVSGDSVFIRGLNVQTRIGCFEDERANPQRVQFDMQIAVDTSVASSSGKLDDSVCYAKVRSMITEVATSRPWVLIEQLGDEICTLVLHEYSIATDVTLTIHKFVFDDVDSVGITFERSR